MAQPIRTFVRDFPWIHLGLGIVGSDGILIGSFGQFLVWIEENREQRERGEIGRCSPVRTR